MLCTIKSIFPDRIGFRPIKVTIKEEEGQQVSAVTNVDLEHQPEVATSTLAEPTIGISGLKRKLEYPSLQAAKEWDRRMKAKE